MLKIIVDENIVFAEEAFSAFGKVQLFPGRKLNNQILKDADILVVRSITIVDEELLKNTRIKFVGTATTGNDHVDQEYLKKKNITLKNKIFSVIGIGNIGSRVVKFAETLGMHILKNDPPLERAEKGNDFVSLDDALQADIISFHVPLTIDGRDKTYHLLNSQNLKRLKDNSILINTSRGEVIDNKALLEITYSKKLKLILDVWEHEPEISKELLKNSEIGTAHIAGYSYEGKLNGTRMIFNALCKFLGEEKNWNPILPSIETPVQRLATMESVDNNLYHLFKSIYNIDDDDSGLRKILKMDSINSANHFDKLRKEYKVRREFSNYTVLLTPKEAELKRMLENFRFEVKLI